MSETPEITTRIIEYITLGLISMILSFFLYQLKKQLSDLTDAVQELVKSNISYGKDMKQCQSDITHLWGNKDKHDSRIGSLENKMTVLESHHNVNHPSDRLT